MTLAAAVLWAASVALDPCGEGVVELRAYQSILAVDPPPWPLNPPDAAAVARGSSRFDTNTTFAAAYAQVRQRLDALALLAAGRSGCEVERLGCFSNAELLLRDLGSVHTAEAQPHWPEAWSRLRRKTARRTMVNLVRPPGARRVPPRVPPRADGCPLTPPPPPAAVAPGRLRGAS